MLSHVYSKYPLRRFVTLELPDQMKGRKQPQSPSFPDAYSIEISQSPFPVHSALP